MLLYPGSSLPSDFRDFYHCLSSCTFSRLPPEQDIFPNGVTLYYTSCRPELVSPAAFGLFFSPVALHFWHLLAVFPARTSSKCMSFWLHDYSVTDHFRGHVTIFAVFSQLVHLYDVLPHRFAIQMVTSVESSSFENHILKKSNFPSPSHTFSFLLDLLKHWWKTGHPLIPPQGIRVECWLAWLHSSCVGPMQSWTARIFSSTLPTHQVARSCMGFRYQPSYLVSRNSYSSGKEFRLTTAII